MEKEDGVPAPLYDQFLRLAARAFAKLVSIDPGHRTVHLTLWASANIS